MLAMTAVNIVDCFIALFEETALYANYIQFVKQATCNICDKG
jgi:hypothetical protein